MITVPPKELFIWWTTDTEAIRIGDKAPDCLPDYVRNQYRFRRGWSGGKPKTLWVDERFGKREISEWPDTGIARSIRDDTSAGIVFAGGDLQCFKDVVGLVTDFRLRVMVVT